MSMVRILVVGGDHGSQALFGQILSSDYRILRRDPDLPPIDQVVRDRPDIVLIDLKGAEDSIYILISDLHRLPRAPNVIIYSPVTDPAVIVASVRAGAFDYIVKPALFDTLRKSIHRATAERLSGATFAAESSGGPLDDILGSGEAMREMKELLRAFAPTEDPILLIGESGTGKELAARTIHRLSALGLFVAVNCAAIPDTLFESEMFGVERGAFTDAVPHPGFFERAHGGTLFLDEIGEMPRSSQSKLLRIIEDHEVCRIGATRSRPVTVRIVAATNCDLKQAVAAGRFRRDLYYRVNVLCIAIPNLRSHPEDIPLLAHHFLQSENGTVEPPVNAAAIRKLLQHDWPGNVRELRGLMRRAAILAGRDCIDERHIRFT
ncbi:MAG TPA: sigma-54 dependent transcriptional regulator [Spirochaetia bacterium]|nr:sigma-54 dependent transcriptional regulator [Spirochaetia bacterium]